MPESKKTEVGKLEERTLAVLIEQAEKRGGIGAIKWVVGISVTLLTIAVGGLGTFVISVSSTLSATVEKVSGLKEQNQKDIARLEGSIKELRELIDRRTFRQYGAFYYEGTLVKIVKDELTIKDDLMEMTFRLLPETTIRINDKPARATDLKPGMRVRVMEGEKGKASAVEVQPDLPRPPQ